MLLSVRGLSRSFGGLTVVDDVSLQVEEGTAVGVVGPNGAGKTTLLNLLDGVLTADAGRIELDGRDVTRAPAAQRCRAGVGRTYQTPRPFSGMTVFENVLVGAVHGAGLRKGAAQRRALDCLGRTGLLPRANELAGDLRLLDRKRLELARALACGPRLLLLDEIAGGLTDAELPELIAIVREVRDGGTAVVWIEHIVHALLEVADRMLCLAQGAVLAEGDPAGVLADAKVREVYLGSSVEGLGGVAAVPAAGDGLPTGDGS
ncbi:ABC transporter ATP-binding protein [Pseudonocardia lacus]|uniref:ABC transporter ATP-binding protein n=1 Tax=Pseudonocardia lacus TaxID=2835865 RepID=UPI001BDCE2BF|nr:ABC transporter ATP-binding protein [Pseudonocardia lacus]